MQPKDFVDIALVSTVFYLCLSWLRQCLPPDVTKRTLTVAPFVAAAYFLSVQLDLSLFQRLLESLLLVVLVATVVVYQTDIRRMVDRAFARRPGRQRGSVEVIAVLAQAVPELAAQRVGALIALQGREPWASHLDGGVALEGKASVPLLHSLFDHRTPGHDGALLIEGDVVTQFAVHLPLASALPDVSRFGGTRHAAALGLARACDALVIVVSEERGTISVAEDGSLDEVTEQADLVARLRAFYDRRGGQRPAEPRGGWRHPGLQMATAAVALAAVLWFAWMYSPNTILRTFTVPVAVRNLPDEWALADPLPAAAQVDLLGSEQRLADLDTANLTLVVDLSKPSDGRREVVLGADNLALPPGIELRRIEPASVMLDLEQTRAVDEIPVVVPTIGALPPGIHLVSLTVTPATMTLIVPEGDTPPSRVLTEAVDLRDVEADATIKSRIILPAGTRLPGTERPDVVITLDVRTQPNE